MINIIFLLFTLIQIILSLENVCNKQPNIIFKNESQIINPNLYFFIPDVPFFGSISNSIIIYNEYGNVIDCLNEQDFIKQNNINADIIVFMGIEHVTRDIYSVLYLQFKGNEIVQGDVARIIFMDEFFKKKEDIPIIYINNNVESSFFKNGIMDVHDLTVDEDLNYVILMVREKHLITDAKELFPNTHINDFIFLVAGYCVIDLKTGKEIGAISGNGIFVDVDQWWEYIGDMKDTIFEHREISLDGTSSSGTEYVGFDVTHMNALNLIDGSHFSSKYNNKKLILCNCRVQDTVYLLRWDFANTDTDDNFEIIWKLPSKSALEIIKKEWYHRWEYVNDPFYGPSRSHDLNIINLSKGHILILDNGSNHRTANNPNIACPMTRSVEYKIEMDANGPGYHRITLVFSYPKLEDYPEWIYLKEKEGLEFKVEDCREFWKEYNYQMTMGSSRKTKESDYVMTALPYEFYTQEILDEFPLMIKLDNKGNVINKWYDLNGFSNSYRITLIDQSTFRNGLYSESINLDNSSEYIL